MLLKFEPGPRPVFSYSVGSGPAQQQCWVCEGECRGVRGEFCCPRHALGGHRRTWEKGEQGVCERDEASVEESNGAKRTQLPIPSAQSLCLLAQRLAPLQGSRAWEQGERGPLL